MKMLSSGEVLPLFRWCKDKSWGLQVSELSVLQWIHSVCVFYHLFIFLEGRISCTVLVRRHFHKCVRGSGTTVTLTLIMCWWLWWPSSPSQRLRAGQRKTIVHTHSHSNTHTGLCTLPLKYHLPRTHFLQLSQMIPSKGCFVRFNLLLVTVLSSN